MKKNVGKTVAIAAGSLLAGLAGGYLLAGLKRHCCEEKGQDCDCGRTLDEAVDACEDENAIYGFGPDEEDNEDYIF